MCWPPPKTLRDARPSSCSATACTTAFRKLFSELAEKNHAALIPFLLEGVGGKPELNQPDHIHPTAEGHKIVAENVWKVLKPVLMQ